MGKVEEVAAALAAKMRARGDAFERVEIGGITTNRLANYVQAGPGDDAPWILLRVAQTPAIVREEVVHTLGCAHWEDLAPHAEATALLVGLWHGLSPCRKIRGLPQ